MNTSAKVNIEENEKTDFVDCIDYSFDELLLSKNNSKNEFIDEVEIEIFW